MTTTQYISNCVHCVFSSKVLREKIRTWLRNVSAQSAVLLIELINFAGWGVKAIRNDEYPITIAEKEYVNPQTFGGPGRAISALVSNVFFTIFAYVLLHTSWKNADALGKESTVVVNSDAHQTRFTVSKHAYALGSRVGNKSFVHENLDIEKVGKLPLPRKASAESNEGRSLVRESVHIDDADRSTIIIAQRGSSLSMGSDMSREASISRSLSNWMPTATSV